jgi:hypothetical protein
MSRGQPAETCGREDKEGGDGGGDEVLGWHGDLLVIVFQKDNLRKKQSSAAVAATSLQ